jgi:hypothetical protein
MNVLEKYIFEFHECISGVYAKSHTRTFIHEELMNVYQKFQNSAASCTGPVMFFSIDIYEVILSLLLPGFNFICILFFIGYLGDIFQSNEIYGQSSISFHDVF